MGIFTWFFKIWRKEIRKCPHCGNRVTGFKKWRTHVANCAKKQRRKKARG